MIEFLKRLNKHQWSLIGLSFLIMFVLTVLDSGIIASAILTFIFGFFLEMAYCYAPYKETKFLGMTLQVIDWNLLIEQAKDFALVKRHNPDNDNVYMVAIGVGLFVILKLILFLF